MKRSMTWLAASAAFCGLLCSCAEEGQERKETFPVSGEVYVDGEPVANLAVRCIAVGGIDKENPTTSAAFTDEEGKFEISTYESSDGVPEGEYILTFEWGKWGLDGSYGGPDKLDGRYNDPEKSEHRITVVKGQPTELGRIDLTTK